MKKSDAVKLPKFVDQTFIDEVNSLSSEALQDKIVELQIHNQQNEEFKESPGYLCAEEEFQQAKISHNLVAGPVKDVTTAIRNKTKLVLERMKEKGLI